MLIAAKLSTEAQIGLIIAIIVVFVLVIIANCVLLFLLRKRRKKRKLCSAALQERREQLLEELYGLRSMPEAEAEEEDDEDDEYVEPDETVISDGTAEDEFNFNAEIMPVRDMSAKMREKFGFTDAAYDKKSYYVRCRYGFEARLRNSTGEIKARYEVISNEFGRIKKAGVNRSFAQERVYVGRRSLAVFLFRGKTLCIAFALDPKDFEGTRYRGEDMSEVKRFANTPMLLRLTSARRVATAVHLISLLVERENLELHEEPYKGRYDFKLMTRSQLFDEGLLKISVLGEAGDIEEEYDELDGETAVAESVSFVPEIMAVSDMSDLMRYRLGLVGSSYEGKRYYVRTVYSFEARLRLAGDEVKERYGDFINETGWYKKLAVREGFKKQRLQYGRRTVGLILFRGKTLCVALALDPKQYEETKYRGVDLSGKKSFASTPMLLKLTSKRRTGYAKYLLNRMAEDFTMELNAEPYTREFAADGMTRDELYANNLIKITVIGEVKGEDGRDEADE